MYRNLTVEEIEVLENKGCSARNWAKVKVKNDGFNVNSIQNVRFSGDVLIGSSNGKIELTGGFSTRTGIKNVLLHNCIIGDDVYINNVTQYIANYKIGNNVVINAVECIICEKDAVFGNGTEVSVLNEVGGREVPIFDNLSSHLAYIIALYRHREDVIEKLKEMISDYTDSVRSDMGEIGEYSKILNSGEIHNVRIGDYCAIIGASELIDGSINSTKDAPSIIGRDVIAKHFIMCNSSKITDGAIIDKCFIGQGTEIGKHYSAENSLFFANCVGMHGEACSIFAGPYTVTHHKASLLIAGMYSFLNAGSGSNQSNHMYKLGPIHQGIIERGSKTTSDSYILWPMKIGAFSLVMGRHYNNADTSNMPFSYLIEADNATVLVPGVNLKSVGTIRDVKKWPTRDKRKCNNKIDLINFNLLSPYTIRKMIKGEDALKKTLEMSGADSKNYVYQNCRITNSGLKKGLMYYNMAITKFLGNSLIKRLENREWKNIEEIRERLLQIESIEDNGWTDLSGLIAPKSEVNKLIDNIANGTVSSLDGIHSAFRVMYDNYYEYEWTWVIDVFCERIGKKHEELEIEDLINYVEEWKSCVISLDNELYNDAHKEFTLNTKTGFGIDGGERTKIRDFEAVRGDFDRNDFVQDVLEHIGQKSELANEFIERISRAKA